MEEEYSSNASTKSVNVTNQFRNTLLINKGSTSRFRPVKGDFQEEVKVVGKSLGSWGKGAEVINIELSNSFDNSAFKVGIAWELGLEVNDSLEKLCSQTQKRSWNEIWKEKQMMSSSKIISQMKS